MHLLLVLLACNPLDKSFTWPPAYTQAPALVPAASDIPERRTLAGCLTHLTRYFQSFLQRFGEEASLVVRAASEDSEGQRSWKRAHRHGAQPNPGGRLQSSPGILSACEQA